MDVDFIRDDMVPKPISTSKLFHGDTLHILSGKLDPCDVVSLLYLMSDSGFENRKIYETLSNINQLIEKDCLSAKIGIDFPKICKELIPDWENKIIEALVEIQQFDALLDVFGVNKLDALYNVSINERALNTNKIKIFKLCDGLDDTRKKTFRHRMKEELSEEIVTNMPPMDFEYLEMYFMFWHTIDKITPSGKGFDLIVKGLQVTGLEELLALFLPAAKLTLDDYTLATYPILNEDKVGLCVIVNQEYFDNPHNNRKGAALDEDRLKSVMESLNFDVETRHNLKSSEIPREIKETIGVSFKKSHSMVFVAVMSHGQEGYVMGKEGIYLSTQHIVKALDMGRLARIPKILVVCACRGTDAFTRASSSVYEADAPEDQGMTLRSDIMDIITCFSTINGFISLRNKEKGTLFVQVLCDVLTKRPDLEICELFTTVNKALMHPKEFSLYNPYKLAHPCEFTSRLLKKLYLKRRT